MSPRYVAGPDIDLARDVVRDRKGRRITERRAREIAADTLEKAGVGGPSVTAPGLRSPEVKACVPKSSGIACMKHHRAYTRAVSS